MKSTPRESDACKRLAEALLEFAVAHDEGCAHRRALRPREEVSVKVELPDPAPMPSSIAVPAAAHQPDLPEGAALLSVKQACKYLGIGERLIWTISAPRGPLACVKIGKLVRYPIEDLDAFIASRREKPWKGHPLY